MKVLILGSGGREHTLCWKIKQSPKVADIFVAPGNAGTNQIANNVNLNIKDNKEIADFIKTNKIDMIVIGPEDPLVNGITDYLEADKSLKVLMVIGPSKAGAILEGSKDFAKQFMQKYNITTAKYMTATKDNFSASIEFLKTMNPPYVLKADGLAAGKGVLILDDFDVAIEELYKMLNGKFGEASSKVVLEEFLDGVECSVFAITDGKDFVVLPEAKDYKRIGEGNTGLNTGGMGAVSPVPFYNAEFETKVLERVVKPTIYGINNEKIKYTGFVFFGLINVKGDPYVIEYNVRMGDPETEVVLPRLKSDLVEILIAASNKTLKDIKPEYDSRAAATVMLVSGGYPEAYEKGKIISGFDKVKDTILFHAGTKVENGNITSSGGRVIALSSFGGNIFEALEKSYKTAEVIVFDKVYYRKDLGFDLK
ncbi:MAG: phosphoribosylamine--glycine ligase [Marinilabiliales bacterium]|nr:MAG: phosphoribosylamine--glycine ligase [Marinilabiliales bacterium]